MNKRIMHIFTVWGMPILFLLVALKEIHLAQQYAEIANFNFSEAVSFWSSEIETNKSYSGSQMGMVLRIDRAVYSFIIFGLFAFHSIYRVKK